MKIEQEKLELAARIFFSEEAIDQNSGKILTDRLLEVKLHQKFNSENKNSADLYMYANGNGKGWVLLSADTDLPAVWADSDKEFEGYGVCPSFEMIVESYLWEIDSILERIKDSASKNDEESLSFMKTITDNQLQWERLFSGELTQSSLYIGAGVNAESNGRSNLVDARWNQDGEYNGSINRYCQNLKKKPDQYLVGCGAVALAQILRQRALAKCDPKHEGIIVHGNSDYRWEGHQIEENLKRIWHSTMMQDSIWDTTPQDRKNEVMNFLRDTAFMIKSDFGTGGTSSNFDDTRDAIRKYISGGTCSEIMNNVDSSFWQQIRDEVTTKKRPVLVRGSKTKSGHAFIIDGYNREISFRAFGYEDFYHWNMGWGYTPGSDFWGRGCEYMQGMAAIFEIDLKN